MVLKKPKLKVQISFMSTLQTKLKVSDNSGVKIVKCIKILKNFTKRGKFLGTFLIVSVKELKLNKAVSSKIKKGQLFKALVVRSKSPFKVKNGIVKKFDKSFVVLLTKQNNFLGTRIFGILPKQIKMFKKIQLGALALGFV